MQRRLFLREPALLQDVAAAVIERGQCFTQACRRVLLPVGRLDEVGGVGIFALEEGGGRKGPLFVVGGAKVEGCVTRCKTLFHLHDFAHADAKVLGNGLRFVM